MYITICEIDCQSRFDAWDRVLRAGALWWPWGMGLGGRWEGGSGRGTHVHPWLIHVNVWEKPLQYCNVISLQLKKKKETLPTLSLFHLCWRPLSCNLQFFLNSCSGFLPGTACSSKKPFKARSFFKAQFFSAMSTWLIGKLRILVLLNSGNVCHSHSSLCLLSARITHWLSGFPNSKGHSSKFPKTSFVAYSHGSLVVS